MLVYDKDKLNFPGGMIRDRGGFSILGVDMVNYSIMRVLVVILR